MYVILSPHSSTNLTDEFVVCDSVEWARFANRQRNTLPVSAHCKTYKEAESKCDELNAQAQS